MSIVMAKSVVTALKPETITTMKNKAKKRTGFLGMELKK